MDRLQVKVLVAAIIFQALITVDSDPQVTSLEYKLNEAEGLMETLWDRIMLSTK